MAERANTGHLRIAVCQTAVVADIWRNADAIVQCLEAAAARGADLAHFCEGALSGYAKAQIKTWSGYDFEELLRQTERIQAACQRLGVWAVFGSVSPSGVVDRPFNSLLAIDAHGRLVARYDKRFCSFTEVKDWYAEGDRPVFISVNGLTLGFAACIEIQFPELFQEYEALGADIVLFSSYSDNAMFTVQAQGHAACNCLWISSACPAGGAEQAACLIGPDGRLIDAREAGAPQMIVQDVVPSDPKWEIPLRRARPWRRQKRRDKAGGV